MILIDKLKSLKNNKAFTLIELIVVIAVIGILVLLAAPKFLGYTKDAKLAQIKNDVRAVESDIEVELVRAEVDEVDKLGEWDWSTIETDKMQEYVDEGSLFDRKGTVNELEQNEFYAVDKGDISVKSKLKGNFIYATGGKIFYQDDGESGSGEGTEGETEETEVPEGFTLLTDDDFEFIEDSYAPNTYTVGDETARGYFHYIGEADKVVIPHEIMGNKVEDYYRMFHNNGTDGNGATVTAVVSDNSSVTNMSYMFDGSQADSLDLSSFNTENVTNMNRMFFNLPAKLLDVSSFDTKSVVYMSGLFRSTKAEEIIGLDEFDTSNVTDMHDMFSSSKATTLDLSGFDTSNVTNMRQMFDGSIATSLTGLDKFDTSNVTIMNGMFWDSRATELDLSSFDTSNVRDMNSMFWGSQAESLDLSSFDTSNVRDMSNMFWDSLANPITAKDETTANRFTSDGSANSSRVTWQGK